MPCLVIKRHLSFLKELQRPLDNSQIIRIHNIAILKCHHLIMAHALSHPQRQRAILFLIPEGKFTFIAIARFRGRRHNAFPAFHGNPGIFQKPLDLPLLQLQFLLVPQRLVGAAAAKHMVRTHSRLPFQGRTLDDLQQARLDAAASFFTYLCPHPLPGYGIFYNHPFPFVIGIGFIWKIHIRNLQNNFIFFLHQYLQNCIRILFVFLFHLW